MANQPYDKVVADSIRKRLLTEAYSLLTDPEDNLSIEKLNEINRQAIQEAQAIEFNRLNKVISEVYGTPLGAPRPLVLNDPNFTMMDDATRKIAREDAASLVQYPDLSNQAPPEGSILTPSDTRANPSGSGTRVIDQIYPQSSVTPQISAIPSTIQTTSTSSSSTPAASSTPFPTDLGPNEKYTRNAAGGYDYIQFNPATRQWEYSRGDKAGTPYNMGGSTAAIDSGADQIDPDVKRLTDELAAAAAALEAERLRNEELKGQITARQAPELVSPQSYVASDFNPAAMDERGLQSAANINQQFINYLKDNLPADQWLIEQPIYDADGVTVIGSNKVLSPLVNLLANSWEMANGVSLSREGLQTDIQIADINARGGVDAARFGATPFGAFSAAGATVEDLQKALTTQAMGAQAGLTPEQRIAQTLAGTGGAYGALGGVTGGYTTADIESLVRGGLTADQILQQTRAQYLPQLLQASPQSLGGLAAILGQEAVKNIYAPYTGQVPGLVTNASGTEQLLSGSNVPAFTQEQRQSNAPISTIGQFESQTPTQQGGTLANLAMMGLDPEKAMKSVTQGGPVGGSTLSGMVV